MGGTERIVFWLEIHPASVPADPCSNEQGTIDREGERQSHRTLHATLEGTGEFQRRHRLYPDLDIKSLAGRDRGDRAGG